MLKMLFIALYFHIIQTWKGQRDDDGGVRMDNFGEVRVSSGSCFKMQGF